MIQPVAFSGQFTDRVSQAIGILRGNNSPACVVGINPDALSRGSAGDLFIRRRGNQNKPCLGQEMIRTILEFKAQLARNLHAQTTAELPAKGIIRIGITLPVDDSTSGKDVALDVLVDEKKYLWIKGKVPHTFNGYDVYMHKSSPDNLPIT